tara:strand:+ start:1367 stop:1897 length:531 start_codon:yes stop_codon:yes gene_type:complete
MACDLTAGRLLKCKDSVGGIRAVGFIQLAEYVPTYSSEVLSSVSTVTGYAYDLARGSSSLNEAYQVSVENGSVFYEQTLTLKLSQLSATDRAEIHLLLQNRLVCIVLDNNDNQWVIGEINGAEVVSGGSMVGQGLGDFYGYDLTLVAQEKVPMRSAGTPTDTIGSNITGLTLTPGS